MIPSDENRVAQLLQDLWGHNPLMLTQYRVHRSDWPQQTGLIRKTIVARQQDEVAGVGTLFESTLHPQFLMLVINVAQHWQRQGVGTQLYAALSSAAGDRSCFVKASRSDIAGQCFLERRGYREVSSTLTGVLKLDRAEVAAWAGTLPANIDGCRIVKLIDAPPGVSQLLVARLLAKIYAQYHAWNPPREWSDAEVVERFLGPATIYGSELCLIAGDTPIGAAVLFKDTLLPRPKEGYLVHVGVLGLDHPKAAELTHALIRAELEYAAANGLNVRFEADAEYIPHQQLYAAAPAVEIDQDLFILAGRQPAG